MPTDNYMTDKFVLAPFASKLFLQLVALQNLSDKQQLQVAAEILSMVYVGFADRLQAMQMALGLLEGEAAKQFFEEHWVITHDYHATEISNIPLLAELTPEERLPTNVRDELYQRLRIAVNL